MHGRAWPSRADLVVGGAFVLAAMAESVASHRETPGLLAFGMAGAPVLAALALRRTRPALPLCLIAAFSAIGTTVQSLAWPEADDSGGVWMFALILAAYSLGAHAHGRVVVLGGLLPLAVGLAIDLPTMEGWAMLSGVVYVALFLGLLPTAVGRLVRVRRQRLALLEDQARRIAREQQAAREAAVVSERLLTTERLRPALLDGLGELARQAERGVDPGTIEEGARLLLGRTREEVVALTAPVEVPACGEVPVADHLGALRTSAQPWVVLGAGVIAVGLVLETVGRLPHTAPAPVVAAAGLAVGVPLALAWWRPLVAIAVAWAAVVGFSRAITPLDTTLAGTTFALGAAFCVAALSARRVAVAGLVLCLVGQVVGVRAGDPFGESVMILVCWFGGLGVNETSRLVERGRTYTRVLTEQEEAGRLGAVVAERLRLARELHDQIGHSLTVVALQAGAARRMVGRDPDRVPGVLATIATAAREGLTALTGDQPTDVASLLRRTREAGLEVTAAGLDGLDDLAPAVREVAYRVVQEALTNALRHAPGAAVLVAVRREGGCAELVVRNGPPTAERGAAGSGLGLAGLRVRVTACAGSLGWEAGDEGGFEVRAALPAGVPQLEEVRR